LKLQGDFSIGSSIADNDV